MLDITDIAAQLPRNPADPNWFTRPIGAIRYIVVHYDDVLIPGSGKPYDPLERYRQQAIYHMNKNWNEGPGKKVPGFGIMYHYKVSADGRIWRTQPEELITWHARKANYNGLAVCCDLGSKQLPPDAQLEGLSALLNWLCYHRPDIPAGRPDVWGHGELRRAGNQTDCPGGVLPFVQTYRAGG